MTAKKIIEELLDKHLHSFLSTFTGAICKGLLHAVLAGALLYAAHYCWKDSLLPDIPAIEFILATALYFFAAKYKRSLYEKGVADAFQIAVQAKKASDLPESVITKSETVEKTLGKMLRRAETVFVLSILAYSLCIIHQLLRYYSASILALF